MLTLSQIWIYPVKALRGISLTNAVVEGRGLQYDRRWMVINDAGKMITQRDCPIMAHIETAIDGELVLTFDSKSIHVPLEVSAEPRNVVVQSDTVASLDCGDEAAEFLTDILGRTARLVWMPESTQRQVDETFAQVGEVTSFSDAFPFLILGEAAVADLNDRILNNGGEAVEFTRFRTNFLFAGGPALDEEAWEHFRIGEVEFEAVKPCSRCIVTTVDQISGVRMGTEPLRTLREYRKFGSGVYMGQNLLARSLGNVEVGQTIEVLSRKTPLLTG